MKLAGFQLVDELLTPLLPRFLSVQGQKQPLDDQVALQSQVLLNQVSHGPWVYLMMPCQLPYASVRISAMAAWTFAMEAKVWTVLLPLSCSVRSWLSSCSIFILKTRLLLIPSSL
jgi:hypothetical protein